MSRSRLVLFSAVVAVVIGVAAAVGMLWLGPARAAIGPLPAEALVLPADATWVMGLDMRRFVASPFYQRQVKSGHAGRPQAMADIEEKIGLNPERDLDSIVIAGNAASQTGVALVTGSFDRYKLGRHLESEKGVTWKKLHGTEVYLFAENRPGRAGALALLTDGLLALGDQASVEATLAAQAEGRRPLRDNAALVGLLGALKPGSTLWMVGDQSVLAALPKALPAPGASGQMLQLPTLQSLSVTGDLDPQVTLELTGGTADAAAAKNLADVVRGLVAFLALQAGQKPELQQLASAISVTTEASQVHVSARLPYELLDALAPKPSPAPRPSGPESK